MKQSGEAHNNSLPSPRKVRRACNRELYRTIKKLKIWIPPEQIVQAEEIYYRKVITNLPWIVENGSNRRLLSDWWETEVCPLIAAIWNVEAHELARAFRDSFGG